MPKFQLRRVRLNGGGYDRTGRYWGVDLPLYYYSAEYPARMCHAITSTCEFDGPFDAAKQTCPECGRPLLKYYCDPSDHIRAYDREDAMRRILQKYPDATFYRMRPIVRH